MTRREIFFFVSLAYLGIFILIGAYLWKENRTYYRDLEGINTSQAEDLQKEETDFQVSQTYSGKALATKQAPGSNASKGAAVPGAVSAGSTGTVKGAPAPAAPATTPAPAPAPAKSSNTALGAKVGDIVKLGDVEMIVTKSTARHKVIDITLKGNNSSQPPKLVLSDNNRIVYEIPVDVDVNFDVTEKTTIDKSPIFYGN
ncbi:MAG: hypothetical protein ACYC0Q_16075 [Eubacteriales bacterium]